MQVAKWGNSLAVRLPAVVVEALQLKKGDRIEIEVAGARRFEIRKAPGARELLARLRKYRGRLPADFSFDRIEANALRRFSILTSCSICSPKMQPRLIGPNNS
jgi:antitoxin MazE